MSRSKHLPVTRRPSTALGPVERRLRRQLDAERQRREQAEAELHTWEDRFRIFLDHAPMPAFIRDERGRHVYGNQPWAAQFDRPLVELLGKTNWELFPKDTALIFEASDQATRLRGGVNNLLESGLAPDGKRHWWKVFKFPLPGPGGEPWVGGLALDVTDLVLAKTRLRDFEQDLASGRLAPRATHGSVEQLRKLPPRLRQMLELLAAGWTVKEAAGRLGISPKTAEVHRSKLLGRLGVKNVVEAVRLMLENPSENHR